MQESVVRAALTRFGESFSVSLVCPTLTRGGTGSPQSTELRTCGSCVITQVGSGADPSAGARLVVCQIRRVSRLPLGLAGGSFGRSEQGPLEQIRSQVDQSVALP